MVKQSLFMNSAEFVSALSPRRDQTVRECFSTEGEWVRRDGKRAATGDRYGRERETEGAV